MCALFYSPYGSLPPLENPASRTGSRMAHIIVRIKMQLSLHGSPFKKQKQQGFYNGSLQPVKKIHFS
jgi:hypothetical protein